MLCMCFSFSGSVSAGGEGSEPGQLCRCWRHPNRPACWRWWTSPVPSTPVWAQHGRSSSTSQNAGHPAFWSYESLVWRWVQELWDWSSSVWQEFSSDPAVQSSNTERRGARAVLLHVEEVSTTWCLCQQEPPGEEKVHTASWHHVRIVPALISSSPPLSLSAFIHLPFYILVAFDSFQLELVAC